MADKSISALRLLQPAIAAPPLPADRVEPEYRRLRRQVFIGIFIGYAAFYLVRKNFALAMPDILRVYPQYSKAALGSAMTGLSIAYGVSKFMMGSVSDRSNPRWFMTPVHMDPEEAVQAYRDITANGSAPVMVPIHWGTFKLTDEQAEASNGAGAVFNLEPESGRYYPSIAFEPVRLPLAQRRADPWLTETL